jgi:DNA-binding transcriptional ArsR family regulator
MSESKGLAEPKAETNGRTSSCSRVGPSKLPDFYALPLATLEKVKGVLNEDASTTVAVFKALADPLRLRILKALRVSDLCVCVFVELLDCEYSRLSYHLKVLKEAGLVECAQDGKFLIYHLTEFGKALIDGMGAIEQS